MCRSGPDAGLATPSRPRIATALITSDQIEATAEGPRLRAADLTAGQDVVERVTQVVTRHPIWQPRVVEPSPEAADLFAWTPKWPLCLVFGHERTGVSPELAAQAHTLIRIPMLGHKRSLNVATAAGVVLYELITGATPFAGGTSRDVLRRQLRDLVVPPSLRCSADVPSPLERVILRAL